uniref:peptidoglycan-binding protein LysM n=1 Tax=Halomonas sp. TaxID=1486246 RepID=UPI0026145F1C|nr:peptidoglycan-binding protein LysM [Halomonas sp.]
MGVFDFVKSVGKKLGVVDDAAPDVAELKKELDSHQLGTDNVELSVDGEQVTLKGEVTDQSAFEKVVIAVGNTLGVSKVQADELKVAGAGVASEAVFYTVKEGDNLWKIAEENYGKENGAKYTVIFEANKPMLSDPDSIYPGQVLRIPALAES